jgi:anaerobic ribonucleoside-triphosphate reductase activating protein
MSRKVRMLLHAIITHSRVNGPGVRSVVYFQGCDLGCIGCWNPGTHASAGTEQSSEDVAAQVLGVGGIDGVTFSGGEPMQQAPALAALISILKARSPSLSIGMYSGYTERELDASAFWPDVRQNLDFAVLGRFVAAKPSSLPLRTSANQILRLFSGRYCEEDFQPQECEVQITQDGLVQITGFPLAGSPA